MFIIVVVYYSYSQAPHQFPPIPPFGVNSRGLVFTAPGLKKINKKQNDEINDIVSLLYLFFQLVIVFYLNTKKLLKNEVPTKKRLKTNDRIMIRIFF